MAATPMVADCQVTALIQFGDGDIEAVTQFVLEAADYLPAVLERVSLFNG